MIPFKRLKVLGKWYRVTPGTDKNRLGECDLVECRIGYRPDQHIQQARETLLHELIHAISDAQALNLSERRVRALGMSIMAIVADNPGLLEWLAMQDDG